MQTPSSRLFLGLIPWYGLLIVLGAALAIFLAEKESRRLLMPADTVLDLALRILPAGILGARAYYVLFSWPVFQNNPLSALYIWEGGLAIYGGLIAGVAVLILFCRKRKLSVLQMLDIIVPGVVLAQTIGRWGNYFNQEAYGLPLPSDSPFAFFPLAVLIQEQASSSWHLATFFYESVWDFGIFVLLLAGRRRWFRRRGDVFLFYLLCYSAGRLVIENLRMDSLWLGTGIRISQLLSILILTAVIGIFHARQDGHSFLPAWARLPLLLAGLAATALLLVFCLTDAGLFSGSPARQTGMMAVYSLMMLAIAVLFYGRSKTSEVYYASHKA